jgi:hypothetical protein
MNLNGVSYAVTVLHQISRIIEFDTPLSLLSDETFSVMDRFREDSGVCQYPVRIRSFDS